MNKNVLRDNLEQGQIIVEYINNHLMLAWNELTLINQAIDQTKRALNLTIEHVASLADAQNAITGKKERRMSKVVFAIPDLIDSQVVFDESFEAALVSFVNRGDLVYILSPSLNRDFATQLVTALKKEGTECRFVNFMLEQYEAETKPIAEFIYERIFTVSALVFSIISAAGGLQTTSFHVAQSQLVGTNYTFQVFPIEREEGTELTDAPMSLPNEISGKARTFLPNEATATRNAIVYAIARRWSISILDTHKNATLRRIVEWQNTLDRQIAENKRLLQRLRGVRTDEDIQELSILNSEDPA